MPRVWRRLRAVKACNECRWASESNHREDKESPDPDPSPDRMHTCRTQCWSRTRTSTCNRIRTRVRRPGLRPGTPTRIASESLLFQRKHRAFGSDFSPNSHSGSHPDSDSDPKTRCFLCNISDLGFEALTRTCMWARVASGAFEHPLPLSPSWLFAFYVSFEFCRFCCFCRFCSSLLFYFFSFCVVYNGISVSFRVESCWRPSVLWRCWLGGRKGIRPVKNWVVGCRRGYLSGARCRLAYGPADATATHCFLLQ